MGIQENKSVSTCNETDGAYPLDKCLQQLVEEQVAQRPDAAAVRFEGQDWCYRELNQRANRLAHQLRAWGIRADSLVGVQMERSCELIVALLAILKAGGAYLPLDPYAPEARLALMVEDAALPVILTQQCFRRQWASYDGKVFCLDEDAYNTFPPHDDNPECLNGPDELAYVIYTSGSTGQPKGCMLPHKAVCNRLLWMQRHYKVGPGDYILHKTPITFDVSVWELFLPLVSGACLVIARPEGHKDAHYLVELIQSAQITHCHFVPSMLRFFLKHPAVSACRSLKQVFVSGEALTHALLLCFRQSLSAELHNLYGPTEAAIDVTYWLAEARQDQRVPIGRPIDNIQIHILDQQGHPVPIGDTGELCIGGIGLARAYLNRPALTAEKFIPDPFSEALGARLYRTGDRARFLDDGEIEWLGRFDEQIKLRGFRIELGEIENTLRSHAAIDDAVVLVKDPDAEDPKLVAVVVAKGLDKKAVRDFIKSRLPEYMVPNLVRFVDQIPVTVHGKLDRKALLDCDEEAVSKSRRVSLPTLLTELRQYFIEALGLAELTEHDDLFDQGATSFTLVQAAHHIQQQYQRVLPVDVLLETPTIAAVAAYLLHISDEAEEEDAVCPNTAPACSATLSDAPIALERVRFVSHAKPLQGSCTDWMPLGRLLSLLREIPLAGQGKYLYASAGGLNAVQCYLYAAEGRIAGLAGGLYYYQPRLNRLLPVNPPALDSRIWPAAQRVPCTQAGFALFLIADMDAIAPIYNRAAPSLVVLEAGYIEQMLLSRQADFGLTLTPVQGIDVALLAERFKLHPRHRFLLCLIEGTLAANGAANASPLAAADCLEETNHGFALPDKAILAELHQQQRQIRTDLPEAGAGVIDLPCEPINAAALRLRAAKRQYLDGPLGLDQLSRLLSLLRAEEDSPPLYRIDPQVQIKIYLHLAEHGVRAEGAGAYLPAGIYQYDAVGHRLLRVGDVDLVEMNRSYTPFNRKHAQHARLRIFIIEASASHREPYASLLQAGRMGQLLLEKQSEFGIGLCPIGSMHFDKIRARFALKEDDVLLHSWVGGAVNEPLPYSWPRLEIQGDARQTDLMRQDHDAMAVIGISGRFPDAHDPHALWHNLRQGHSSIRMLSREALLRAGDEESHAVRWAVGALADKDLFDPLLFKIPPAEAKTLDPQARLFLQTVWHCLENSGYTAEGLKQQAGRIGVFVGAMWGDYQHHPPTRQGEQATAFLSAIANRVSFFNDFEGPSVTVDTSCSSAMTALHLACSSIRQGECRAAIVGGVNLISHPAHLTLLTSLQLLSDDGQARPFSREANGWVPGEGVGALLIRPLEDALREGDPIWGVIRATAMHHSGKTSRYGAPNADSQAMAMRQLLAQAAWSVDDIGYIEAAAPGASLADGAEFAAIAQVFGARRADTPLWVGSIKANIGHLESASALSQIIKVLLQFHHGQIAPTLGCDPLSPMIAVENNKLAVADQLIEWPAPQRALINAFGASGSGGHLLLEAPPAYEVVGEDTGPWLFPFAANSEKQLDQLISAFISDLQAGRFNDIGLSTISYTLCVGRAALSHRRAFVAANREELVSQLQDKTVCRAQVAVDTAREDIVPTLQGRDRQALITIARQWVSGVCRLDQIARQEGDRRVALTAYPFATVDCHIAAARDEDTIVPLAVADGSRQRALQDTIRRHFSEVTGIAQSDIDGEQTFDHYGLSSLMITTLTQRLSQTLGEVSTTLLFEHQSIAALAAYLAARAPRNPLQPLRAPREGQADEPIAIIGLSGRFPGARDIDAFWDNLYHGVDSISEIPAKRWQHVQYYSQDRHQKGKIHTKWGGFIEDADCFDPLFFNISPRDAERMDPQERIFLETAWQTLEDAGYDRDRLQRHDQGAMGVFVGVMHGEYLLYTRSTAADCTDDAVEASFGSIANRVSYVFDCHGPSMAVDTICSSSLTALHLAVESLKRQECRLALAGGVNLSLHPNKYFVQSQLTMSSSDGRCRSFGEGGDGFVPGEGVGAVLLKPLSRAQAEGDHIYGVIRATTINHNGKTHGYTVPSPKAQGRMIAASLSKAGMDPRELSYIEAHGTGTRLGDPIEITGLQQGFASQSAALGTDSVPVGHCALGSVKSNIGHLESAAGIAGVAKVLLQLKYGQLVPSLHSARLHPEIDFAHSPFYIPQQSEPWQRPVLNLEGESREYPRVASVSSFGSGGANAHVMIEEYRAPAREPESLGQTVMIPLSARTLTQLQQRVERLQGFLDRVGGQTRLVDLAYTLQQGREAMAYRLAFCANSMADVRDKLTNSAHRLAAQSEPWGSVEDIHIGRVQDHKTAMSVLAHDEDMGTTLSAWARKGKYHKLLTLWVKGLALDWSTLSTIDRHARRISLPGYPFARERIWVSTDTHFPHQALEARLHPLLHANVSDLSRQKFVSTFYGDAFFLRDHRVGEHKVLPAVAYLEMAREAMSRSLGEQAQQGMLSLSHVVWSQPLVLAAEDEQALKVEVHIDCLDVHTLAFDIVDGRKHHSCCQGEAVLTAVIDTPVTPLAELQTAIARHTLSPADLYALFEHAGIHYGHWHRSVQALWVEGGQALARIALPQAASLAHHRFVLHPSLLDGAMQTVVGVLAVDQREAAFAPKLEHTWLPFSLTRLQLTGAELGEEIWAWARDALGQAEGEQRKFDIDIYNQQGEHCAALRDLVLRPKKKNSPVQAMLEDPSEEHHYLAQRWQRLNPAVSALPAGKLLLVANDPQSLQQLTTHYPQAASLLLAGSESIERLTEQLKDAGDIDHLLWLAPKNPECVENLDEMIHAQQCGVLACFHLIKALLALGRDQRPMTWTVLTRGALTVFNEADRAYLTLTEPVAPAHASVHGLIGAMAKEYPHWPVRLVDLPSGDVWPSRDPLSLPADADGNALALRGEAWYRAYLAPCALSPCADPVAGLYREGGVYLVVGGAGGIGRVWSEYMIRTHRAQIIWLGRRERNSDIDTAISMLASLGPAPRYLRADACDEARLNQAVAQIMQEHGVIHGVVHAALVLQDQSLAKMSPSRFAAGLAAKVDICVQLAKVFEHQALDFMLLFSSLQSFTQSAGQSNYAAGCAFKNAFGHYLAQQRDYPVKVIHWGYWGEVGSVASDDYRRRMARLGLGSIDSTAAMAALETLLAAPLSQCAFLKTAQRLSDTFKGLRLPTHPDGLFGEYGALLPETDPCSAWQDDSVLPVQAVRAEIARALAGREAYEACQIRLLYALLQKMGWFKLTHENVEERKQASRLLPMYGRWMDQSLALLVQQGYLQWEGGAHPAAYRVNDPQALGLASLWAEWEAQKPDWLREPSLKAEVMLAEAVLRVLPEILTGQIAATDRLFPNASMTLVEGIYQHNPVADFFNDTLLSAMVAFVRARPDTPIRILEIGAGTGGTSAQAFEKLKPYQQQIAEYCYTDVSQAFLMHAREVYGADVPYLSDQLFDVDQPLARQGIALGAYDLVIATNVLHATPDSRRTMRNVKAALKRHGWVLMNEICHHTRFTHLTFGLLKGWWLFDDPALRLPGGPALAPKQWKQVLQSEGFRHIHFPALDSHDLGQQIVIAQSNGMIWQGEGHPSLTPSASVRQAVTLAKPAPRIMTQAASGGAGLPSLKERTVSYLQQVVGGLFKIRPEEIDPHEPLEHYGIDSILVVQLTNLLREPLSGVSSTLFFEHKTIAALADHFLASQNERLVTLLAPRQAEAVLPPTPSILPSAHEHRIPLRQSRFAGKSDDVPRPPARFDVAIIGLSGRYAQAEHLDALWQQLKNGEIGIVEVPANRWDWRHYADPAAQAGHIYTRWGGFLPEIDQFDPLFFHISPREAEKMDPQERLFLEEAYHCIADAGYTPERLTQRRKVGVFVGVMNSTYARQPRHWSIANRVSYQFNFQGPSMAVDTACSSSLSALHLALDSLYSGVSDCALVGGVSLVLDPVHYLGLTEMKMLSPGRACRAFGADADGFVDGEGVGALVLKPLAQAEADGDRIYGVIKGSQVNAGGKTNGYTVPNPVAQRQLVSDALADARIDARAVSYVEAHGTGTLLGDPIEIAALTKAFDGRGDTSVRQYCAVGSIKPNIGHCESAAGIAGVTKVLLQLQHRQLAPSLFAREPNPEIDFAASPFKVQQSLAEWRRPEVDINGQRQTCKRIALVSSFGAGGANACVVIEEYEDLRLLPDILIHDDAPAVVPLSAQTPAQLIQQASRLLAALVQKGLGDPDLPALAYTLQLGREAMPYRTGFLAASISQLQRQLQQFIDQPSTVIVYQGQHQALIEAWVNGLAVDWSVLYPKGTPRPISLPGYPFARERYWHAWSAPIPPESAPLGLHPLLQRNVSDLRGLRYLSRFSGRESLLSEHQIHGRGTMPGAAMITMMQQALIDAHGGQPQAQQALRLHALRWRQSFCVAPDKYSELFLELSPLAEGECQVGIYSYDGNGQITLHCQARAGFTEVPAPQADFPANGAHHIDPAACYQRFTAMGIEYGARFCKIRSLRRQENQVLAEIAAESSVEGARMMLSPELLDAAMQGCMALLLDEQPLLWLPDSVEECLCFSHSFATLQVQIRCIERSERAYHFDLALFNEDGRCCASMRRLSFKAASVRHNLPRGSLCQPQWRDSEWRSPTATPEVPPRIVMLGNHPAFAELAHYLPEQNIANVTWVSGDYLQAAWALAEQIKPLIQAGRPCTVQLVLPLDDAQGYRGLNALLLSASREQPALASQLIEVAPTIAAPQLAQQLLAEAAEPGERQLRYLLDAGEMRRQQLCWHDQPLGQGLAPWRPDGVYLITGGLGGVGRIFAQAILDAAPAAQVVLCGRSAAHAPAVMDKLARLGERCHYHAVDLGDSLQVAGLIDRIVAEHSGLHGIIHCAGITRDAYLVDKTAQDFKAVFAAKVDGVRHLDQASAALALDYFVLCSSIASVLGNAGQCDYAAANGYLDAFAVHRNQQLASGERHGRTLAINWPLWKAGGMAMSERAQQALAKRTGLEAMESHSGIQALYQALACGQDQQMVLTGDVDRLVTGLQQGQQHLIPASVSTDREAPLTILRPLLAQTVKVAESRLDDDALFEQYGIDSLMIMEMTAMLEKRFGPLSKTLFFEYPSLRRLADYLATHTILTSAETAPEPAGKEARLFDRTARLSAETPGREDIAIIGLAGRYPGAEDIDAFWQNLCQGKEAIRDIPAERWDWREYYSDNRHASGVHHSKWGGFIDGVDQFDPLFFRISPLEAELLDPQERLFLQTAWSAMEDAGYGGPLGLINADDRVHVGVYVGVMYGEYQLFGAEASLRGQRMAFAGSNASIANRVSFCLNLQGPSFTVDSMCSSSLTAIHLACQDLRHGHSAMAIAGGINLTLHPNKYLMLSSGQFISNQGQCASFGDGADGYVPAEGVGAIVLKRLTDAQRDGDPIYAVIKGSHLNHGGRSTGYSVPNPRSQQAAIEAALQDAGVDPTAISYVEAHGTGTRLGDPIEIAGLAGAIGKRQAGQTCWIGSVKSNIGHCEAAAGIAGLTKVLLQLKHGQIVPSLHSQTLNPFIDFAATPFEVNQHLRVWPRPIEGGQEKPRIAGISSFGAGGANGHLIVAEYTAPAPSAGRGQAEMIVLSAREPEPLRQMASRLRSHLTSLQDEESLASVAYTLQVGREAMAHRAAFIAGDMASLLNALRRFEEGDERGWICGEAGEISPRVAAFKAETTVPWQTRLTSLFTQGEQQTLLMLWSQGLTVDWAALWAAKGERRNRIHLPAYPFVTRRYWVPAGPCISAASVMPPYTDFTGDEPCLRDHCIQGHKTLPGAAYLTMIRATVMQAWALNAQQAIVIEQLHWLVPLTVASAPRRLQMDLVQHAQRIEIKCLTEDKDQTVCHCQAWVTHGAPGEGARIDLAGWVNKEGGLRLSGEQVYRWFDQIDMVYGASHRGIRQLRVWQSPHQRVVLAQLALEGRDDDEGWVPGIIDSALQAAMGLLLPLDAELTVPASVWMPFELARLEWLAPCQRRMWALLRSEEGDRPTRAMDIDLCDEAGRICLRFLGLKSRVFSGRQTERLLLTPVWEPADSAVSPWCETPRATLIVGAPVSQRQTLLARYPDAVFDHALTSRPDWQEVVWLAPTEDEATVTGPALILAQERGVLALFRLIKTLLSMDYGRRPLCLTVITQQAVKVLPEDLCQPAHAAVHGLVGSLANEYPHWRVRLLDLEHALPIMPTTVPFDAVASGEVLALRQGRWWLRRLARVRAEEAQHKPPIYREGGLYLVIGGAGGIGAVWSQHVIRHHRARVIWVGRQPLKETRQSSFDALTAFSLRYGAPAPIYLQADAAEVAQLAEVKQEVGARFGQINGIVHSAIVLQDQSLAKMDEATFSRVLNAKLATSSVLAQVFGEQAATLDFVLFFSSMMTFSRAAGQSNYAAGCTFADAFADRLRVDWPCPVKVINWGYWGSVGSVRDAHYRDRMAALGLSSIEPEEGMQALEPLMTGALHQLALLKIGRSHEVDGLDSVARWLSDEHIRLYPDQGHDRAAMADRLAKRLQEVETRFIAREEVETC